MKAATDKEKRERNLYLDYLRIIATVAVITLHVAAQNWNNVSIASYEWKVFHVVDSAVRWGVPIFVMISGALMLDNARELSIKKLYAQKILRIIVAFVFWSAFYAVNKLCQGADIKTVVSAFIQGNYHMWFMLMIIGLYIATPILRKITESKRITEYFLITGFFFTFLIPRSIHLLECLNISGSEMYIKDVNAVYTKMHFHVTLGYVYYYILGYYLCKFDLKAIVRKMVGIFGMIGYLAIVLLTVWYSNKTGSASSVFYNDLSINVLLMSAAVFLFAKYLLAKISMKERGIKAIEELSKATFGIYLIHVFILEKFGIWLGIGTLTFNPILSILIIVVGVFMVSGIISVILNHIPVIKKYIV